MLTTREKIVWSLRGLAGAALLAIGLAMAACGPAETQATVGLGNPDPLSKSCATNYVRTAPNYCSFVNGTLSTTTIVDGVCRTIAANATWGTAANATFYHIKHVGHLFGSNTLNALDFMTFTAYTTAGCTSSQSDRFEMSMKEVVIVNNLEIMSASTHMLIRAFSDQLFYASSKSAGAGTNGQLFIVGYYDN